MSFLGSAEIQAQGQKLNREPQIVRTENSQTMSLLEGHLNTRLSPIVNGQLAVVDNSALVAESSNLSSFQDAGINNGQISTYIVREGDTLITIAKMFEVSVNTIVWANDIKSGRITPGQSLVILPISGVKHTVVRGDTLESIARKYKADLAEVRSYNGLTKDSKLEVGSLVLVPDGEVVTVVTATASSAGSKVVAVKSGYYLRPVLGGRKTQGLHGHNGVDLGGLPIGTPVVAAAEGKVIVARPSGYNGGYGLYVVVSHSNGTQTLYSHLSQVNVSTGETVSQGQVIGRLGNTGKSTGPHLHFEIRGAKNPF